MANNYDYYTPVAYTCTDPELVLLLSIANASMHANESTHFMKSPEFLVHFYRAIGLQQKNEATIIFLDLQLMHDCISLNFN